MSNVISHTGKGQRKENQDVILIEDLHPDTTLFCIVDGMGGYEHGKKIAEIIADTICNYLRNCDSINDNKIDEAIRKANLEVKNFNNSNGSKSGATIGGIIKNKEKSFLFWVGDVTIALYKEKNILYRSKSHTLINDMKDMGHTISAKNIEKYKHIVTKSISGKREVIEKGFFEIENTAFDMFFIGSDGVTETISLNDVIEKENNDINILLEKNSKDNYSYILGNGFKF